MIRLLTDLFDVQINGADKVWKLKSVYGLNMTREVESEVADLCTYATAMENKGIEKGFQEGIEKGLQQGIDKGLAIGMESGLKALVQSLKAYVRDFDELYTAVTKNKEFEKVTRETVMKYYSEIPLNS